jgi:hypothetical protein
MIDVLYAAGTLQAFVLHGDIQPHLGIWGPGDCVKFQEFFTSWTLKRSQVEKKLEPDQDLNLGPPK